MKSHTEKIAEWPFVCTRGIKQEDLGAKRFPRTRITFSRQWLMVSVGPSSVIIELLIFVDPRVTVTEASSVTCFCHSIVASCHGLLEVSGEFILRFYHAERGYATICRLSVRPSVRLSVTFR